MARGRPVGLVMVPLIWVIASILLLRRGPFRDGFVLVLLTITLSAVLGRGMTLIVSSIPAFASLAFVAGPARLLVALGFPKMHCGGLLWAFSFGLGRAVSRCCPQSGWWLLIRDVRWTSAPRPAHTFAASPFEFASIAALDFGSRELRGSQSTRA